MIEEVAGNDTKENKQYASIDAFRESRLVISIVKWFFSLHKPDSVQLEMSPISSFFNSLRVARDNGVVHHCNKRLKQYICETEIVK